jgi:hypothetical protein
MMLHELYLEAIEAAIRFLAVVDMMCRIWMAEELTRHGFTICRGTLYPRLRRLINAGLLARERQLAAHSGFIP